VAIDYSRFQSGANPLQMAMQGFSDAGAIQQAQQQRAIGQQNYELNQMKIAEYQKAQAKQQEFQSALAGLGPKPSPQALQKLMIAYPQLGESLKSNFDILNAEQKQNKLMHATQISSALAAGGVPAALELVETQRVAAENSGDSAGADAFGVLKQQIEMNPDAALTTVDMFLNATMGPEEYVSFYEKRTENARKNELQPGALAKQEVELMQLGTNMGVDPKTTQKMIASYRNAGVSQDTARNLFAIEAQNPTGRIYDPKERYAASKDLRTEYNKRTGDLTESRINYDKMLESAKIQAGLGDVALITAFMKMLDPGSTVRDSEFATARDTAGLRASLENYLEKVKTGEFLSDSQRKVFTDLAGKYLEAAEKDGAKTRKSMEGIVDRLGLNPADVFVDVVEEAEAAAFPKITTQEEFDALPSGSVFIENGQQYRKP
jgi:hypothetical protein